MLLKRCATLLQCLAVPVAGGLATGSMGEGGNTEKKDVMDGMDPADPGAPEAGALEPSFRCIFCFCGAGIGH